MTGAAFLLLALTLAAAAGNWLAVHRGKSLLEYVCKPLTMVLLIGVALAVDADQSAVRAWFVAALVLSLAGDVFLMLPRDLFVPGLAAFLVGHLAYIIGLRYLGTSASGFLAGVVLVGLALPVLGTRIVGAIRRSDEADLAIPVAVYMAVISLMVVVAGASGVLVALLGAVAFYVSDALIAWTRFIADFRHSRLAVMVTYHLAQVGLVLALT